MIMSTARQHPRLWAQPSNIRDYGHSQTTSAIMSTARPTHRGLAGTALHEVQLAVVCPFEQHLRHAAPRLDLRQAMHSGTRRFARTHRTHCFHACVQERCEGGVCVCVSVHGNYPSQGCPGTMRTHAGEWSPPYAWPPFHRLPLPHSPVLLLAQATQS